MSRMIETRLCKRCGVNRFRLIKAAFPIKEDSLYYWYDECIRDWNKDFKTKTYLARHKDIDE